MARLSNAERQRRFRARTRSMGDDMLARINTMVSVSASAQLNRLAKHYKMTKKAVLEKVLSEAEDFVLSDLDHKGQVEYFAVAD